MRNAIFIGFFLLVLPVQAQEARVTQLTGPASYWRGPAGPYPAYVGLDLLPQDRLQAGAAALGLRVGGEPAALAAGSTLSVAGPRSLQLTQGSLWLEAAQPVFVKTQKGEWKGTGTLLTEAGAAPAGPFSGTPPAWTAAARRDLIDDTDDVSIETELHRNRDRMLTPSGGLVGGATPTTTRPTCVTGLSPDNTQLASLPVMRWHPLHGATSYLVLLASTDSFKTLEWSAQVNGHGGCLPQRRARLGAGRHYWRVIPLDDQGLPLAGHRGSQGWFEL